LTRLPVWPLNQRAGLGGETPRSLVVALLARLDGLLSQDIDLRTKIVVLVRGGPVAEQPDHLSFVCDELGPQLGRHGRDRAIVQVLADDNESHAAAAQQAD
jgi:hypothetical protein